MTFGTRLRAAREAKKLSQDGLGKGLGTDGKDSGKAVVLGWEKGRHFPRADQLALICERLGVTADYLLFGTVTESSLPEAVLNLAKSLAALPPEWQQWSLKRAWDAIEAAQEAVSMNKEAHQEVPGYSVGRSR